MLFGYPPFYADEAKYGAMTDSVIFTLITKGFDPTVKKGYGPHFPSSMPVSPSAMDLISKLLQSDSAKRLTAEEALNHPWMKGDTATSTPLDPIVISGLRTFEAHCKMKQGVLRIMVDTLQPDEVDALKITFRSIDADGDGNITVLELANAMKKHMGTVTQTTEIERIMLKADIDGNGSLSYEELMLSYVHRKLTAKEERLADAFTKLDLDGDGRVTADEVEKVFTSHHVINTKTDLKKMLNEVDTNGDGNIDYEEFLQMMWASHANDEQEKKLRKEHTVHHDHVSEHHPTSIKAKGGKQIHALHSPHANPTKVQQAPSVANLESKSNTADTSQSSGGSSDASTKQKTDRK